MEHEHVFVLIYPSLEPDQSTPLLPHTSASLKLLFPRSFSLNFVWIAVSSLRERLVSLGKEFTTFRKIAVPSTSGSGSLKSVAWLRDPENDDTAIFRNIGNYQTNDSESHSRIFESSATLLWCDTLESRIQFRFLSPTKHGTSPACPWPLLASITLTVIR